MNEQFSGASAILPFLWIGGWVSASVLFRLSRGKPILFFTVPDATFIERTASGNSHKHWYTRIGGASNCLVVAIAQGKLIVRPFFPFNLMFLPEIYGLEEEIPLTNIQNVEIKKLLFFKRIIITFHNVNREEQSMTLFLRKLNDFMSKLPSTIPILG